MKFSDIASALANQAQINSRVDDDLSKLSSTVKIHDSKLNSLESCCHDLASTSKVTNESVSSLKDQVSSLKDQLQTTNSRVDRLESRQESTDKVLSFVSTGMAFCMFAGR